MEPLMALGTFLDGFLVSSAILDNQYGLITLRDLISSLSGRILINQLSPRLSNQETHNTTGDSRVLPAQQVDIRLRIPPRMIVESIGSYTTAFANLGNQDANTQDCPDDKAVDTTANPELVASSCSRRPDTP
jgi:hypothetical protein